jgi:type III secretory pathway component EscS
LNTETLFILIVCLIGIIVAAMLGLAVSLV